MNPNVFESPLLRRPIATPTVALAMAEFLIPNPLNEAAVSIIKHETLARDISPAEAKDLAAELIDWAKGTSPAVTAISPSQERAQRIAQTAAERINSAATNPQPPTPQQNAASIAVTAALRSATERIIDVVPDGRRKSLAMTALEEAHLWAGRAIYLDGPRQVDEP